MFKKKYIVFPGIQPKGIGEWEHKTSCDLLNERVVGLACYSDYTEHHNKDNCRDYDTAWDWMGPQFFAPSQCLKTYSWNRPKIASPLIGIIGEQSDLTDSYGDYYVSLRKIQTSTAAALAVPFYKTYHFESETEFNDYIESPDYQTR